MASKHDTTDATKAGWLLDTSILVDLCRGNGRAKDWIDSLAPEDHRISVVTVAELLAGCRNRAEQRLVDRELALYTTVWLDGPISRRAVDLYRRHRLRNGVGFLDCLIGASAIEAGLALATLDARHFRSFDGLMVRRPYDP